MGDVSKARSTLAPSSLAQTTSSLWIKQHGALGSVPVRGLGAPPKPSPPQPDSARIFAELERICSVTLNRKLQLQKLLRFIVQKTLAGEGEKTKEYVIATLVFGKAETFDCRVSSLVRTQCSKLRSALLEHYKNHASPDGPWIWVPAGSYQAIFSFNPTPETLPVKQSTFAADTDLQVARISISPAIVFEQKRDLRPLADASVRLHSYHMRRNGFTPNLGAGSVGYHSSAVATSFADATSFLLLENTIIESADRITVTTGLIGGANRLLIYGASTMFPSRYSNSELIDLLDSVIGDFAFNCRQLIDSLQNTRQSGIR